MSWTSLASIACVLLYGITIALPMPNFNDPAHPTISTTLLQLCNVTAGNATAHAAANARRHA